jgi:hypothetical protein
MSDSRDPDARLEEILERAAQFYADFLWQSDTGRSIRPRLARRGVDGPILREFGVGYAPGGWTELLEHLEQWRYSTAELETAGIAVLSDRGRLHVQFRSRVMFPVRDHQGRILGFAALATHPGPSWPQWLTSPERGRYRRRSAIFGIDRAAPAISRGGRALVLNDCLDVLRLHQRGQSQAVAVIRSPVTAEHLEQFAAVLGAEAAAVDRVSELDSELGVGDVRVIHPSSVPAGHEDAGRELGGQRFAAGRARAGIVPDADVPPTRGARALQALVSALLGIGIPVGWLAAIGADNEAIGGAGSGFIVSVGAVVASYVLLTLVASVASGRVRARSRARRMRTPWERGATEWQPTAWTYHMFEEVLIGAALVSLLTCMVLFVTVGGFTG